MIRIIKIFEGKTDKLLGFIHKNLEVSNSLNNLFN